MKQETLYDILNEKDERVYSDFAYDRQCDMYYDPDTNDMVRGDHIVDNHWTVIESGNFVECWR